jgi:hypothetical protein
VWNSDFVASNLNSGVISHPPLFETLNVLCDTPQLKLSVFRRQLMKQRDDEKAKGDTIGEVTRTLEREW